MQGLFLIAQTELDFEESDEYKQGFENSIMEVHRQYNIRRKNNIDTPNVKISEQPAKNSYENEPRKTIDSLPKKTMDNSSKKKVEIPIKKITNNVSKTTQIDVPTTS